MLQPEWLVSIEARGGVEVRRLVVGLSHLDAHPLTGTTQVEVRVRAPSEAAAVEYVLTQTERMMIRPKAIEARPVDVD